MILVALLFLSLMLLPRLLIEARRKQWVEQEEEVRGRRYCSGSAPTLRMVTPQPVGPLCSFLGSPEGSPQLRLLW